MPSTVPNTSYNSYHADRERDMVIILKSRKTEARKPQVVCSLAVNDGIRTEHFYKKHTLTGLNKSSVHRVHSDVSPPPLNHIQLCRGHHGQGVSPESLSHILACTRRTLVLLLCQSINQCNHVLQTTLYLASASYKEVSEIRTRI